MKSDRKIILSLFLIFSLLLLGTSFFAGPVTQLLPGLWKILTSPQVLTSDACALGGLNGALLNAGLLGLMAWALFALTGSRLNGASVGAYFLTVGFAFFGKNCLNVLPIIFGSWIYSIIKKESFGQYVNLSLFACSLSPVVSEALFPRYHHYPLAAGILIALLLGSLIGILFPPLAAHTAGMHKGYNLFNAGLSAGFLAFALFAVYKTFFLRPLGLEGDYSLNCILSQGFPLFFPLFLSLSFFGALLAGFFLNGRSVSGYGKLIRKTGLACDFLAEDGAARVLINFGLLWLLSLGLALLVKVPLTGPTAGALLCIVCWAANGSHPANVLPIMAGYALASIFSAWSLSDQAIFVGLCFATGLSPLSGRWGLHWGVIAGALHACLVSYTAVIHGGFNLYNGGFTAGLLALLLVPLLESFQKSKLKAQP